MEAADLALLGPHELSRLARLRRPDDKGRYAATHAWARRLVAPQLGSEPGLVALGHRPCPACGSREHGPPYVRSAEGEFSVSLSRSGPHGLVALAFEGSVGADIEVVDGTFPVEPVALRLFSEAELAGLRAVPPGERLWAFFCCWARKEALAKALGTGLAAGLDRLDVGFARPGPLTVVASPVPGGAPSAWSVNDLDLGAGLTAALCLSAGPGRVPEDG